MPDVSSADSKKYDILQEQIQQQALNQQQIQQNVIQQSIVTQGVSDSQQQYNQILQDPYQYQPSPNQPVLAPPQEKG